MEYDKERTIKIFKDKKHQIYFSWNQQGNIDYQFVCGPRTNNLWYTVVEDYGKEVIAKIPIGF